MEVLLIALLSFIGAGIGTLSGFGSSTILVPVLVLFLPYREVLLFSGILHTSVDVFKVILFRKTPNWRLIFLFGSFGLLFSLLGARIAFFVPESIASKLVGGFIFMYSVYFFFHHSISIKASWRMSAVGGSLSGLIAGLFGVGGAVRTSFLSAFNMNSYNYIFTAGMTALMIDTVRTGTYWLQGARLSQSLFYGIPLYIGLSFAGAILAKKVISHLSHDQFREIVAGFLFLFGLLLLVSP